MRNVSIFVDSGQQMPSRLPNESTLAPIHSHKQLQLNRFLTLSHMNGTACFLCLLFSYSSYWIQFNESDACESSFSVCMRAVLYCPLRVDFELFILSVDRLAGVHVKASFVYFDNILILRSTTPYHTIPYHGSGHSISLKWQASLTSSKIVWLTHWLTDKRTIQLLRYLQCKKKRPGRSWKGLTYKCLS